MTLICIPSYYYLLLSFFKQYIGFKQWATFRERKLPLNSPKECLQALEFWQYAYILKFSNNYHLYPNFNSTSFITKPVYCYVLYSFESNCPILLLHCFYSKYTRTNMTHIVFLLQVKSTYPTAKPEPYNIHCFQSHTF